MNKIIKTGIMALGLAAIVSGCNPNSEKADSKNKATVTITKHRSHKGVTTLDSIGYVVFETQIPTSQDSIYRTRGVFYSNGESPDSVDITVDMKRNKLYVLTSDDKIYLQKIDQK